MIRYPAPRRPRWLRFAIGAATLLTGTAVGLAVRGQAEAAILTAFFASIAVLIVLDQLVKGDAR